MKVLPIESVFSIWVNFNTKAFITIFSTNSKKLIFEIQKLKIFEKTNPFFFSFFAFITLFQL